jgi:hypothetical protein
VLEIAPFIVNIIIHKFRVVTDTLKEYYKMEVKEFERFLELKNEKEDNYKAFFENEEKNREYYHLKDELESLLFNNQTNTEKTITKLKNSLNEYKYNLRYNPNESLNEIKLIKETMNLIDLYDWKLKYSEYNTTEGKQVAVWEQNGDGQIRNHKVWNVEDKNSIKKHYHTVEINSVDFSEEFLKNVAEKIASMIIENQSELGKYNNI